MAGAIEARERAYGLYKEAGDLCGAARVAIWLANDHIDFRGEEAVARGWFARCERMHPLGANRAYDHLARVALGEQTSLH